MDVICKYFARGPYRDEIYIQNLDDLPEDLEVRFIQQAEEFPDDLIFFYAKLITE